MMYLVEELNRVKIPKMIFNMALVLLNILSILFLVFASGRIHSSIVLLMGVLFVSSLFYRGFWFHARVAFDTPVKLYTQKLLVTETPTEVFRYLGVGEEATLRDVEVWCKIERISQPNGVGWVALHDLVLETGSDFQIGAHAVVRSTRGGTEWMRPDNTLDWLDDGDLAQIKDVRIHVMLDGHIAVFAESDRTDVHVQ